LGGRFAKRIWDELATVENGEEFKDRAHDFPRCVQLNGLSLAVTFFRGKSNDKRKKTGHERYLEILSGVLVGERVIERGKEDAGRSSPDLLIERALRLPPMEYRVLSRKVMVAALWLRRLSEARWHGKDMVEDGNAANPVHGG